MGYYPLTGIHDGVTTYERVPLRLEVDDWWMSQDPVHVRQKSLVILAPIHMQKILPTDPEEGKLSWYQIAGIHGKPWVPWDNSIRDGDFYNYCKHKETLFATWHRLYTLLLEQRLYEVMRDKIIPVEYSDEAQTKMQLAAQEWRWPYWDWSVKKQDAGGAEYHNVPRVTRLYEIEVRTKAGSKYVRNPFYAYKIPGGRSMNDKRSAEDGGLGKYAIIETPAEPQMYGPTTSTSRHVTIFWNSSSPATLGASFNSSKWVKGSQNNDSIMYGLQDEAVLRILDIENFESFATTKRDPDVPVKTLFSVEGIHNNIQVFCGGNQVFSGHISSQNVAAFDPIFWLHHCNVDRIVAFWRALHPNTTWFKEHPDAAEGLPPFRTKEGNYHTSQTVEDTTKLGYTYPGLEFWVPEYQTDGKFDHKKLVNDIKKRLNTKYASTRRAEQKALMSITREQASEVNIETLASLTSFEAPDIQDQIDNQTIATPKAIGSGDIVPEVIEADDYITTVTYKRFGLGGQPFTIHLFIGPVPDERPYSFSDQTTQVGLVYNFVSPLPQAGEKGCENCTKQAREEAEAVDYIVLANALITRFKQRILHSADDLNDYRASMESGDVSAFLQKHLHWRVTVFGGDEIDASVDDNGNKRDPRIDQLGLKVAIAAGKAKHYKDPTKLLEYGDYKIMYAVTEEAPSGTGAKPEDGLFPQNPPL